MIEDALLYQAVMEHPEYTTKLDESRRWIFEHIITHNIGMVERKWIYELWDYLYIRGSLPWVVPSHFTSPEEVTSSLIKTCQSPSTYTLGIQASTNRGVRSDAPTVDIV